MCSWLRACGARCSQVNRQKHKPKKKRRDLQRNLDITSPILSTWKVAVSIYDTEDRSTLEIDEDSVSAALLRNATLVAPHGAGKTHLVRAVISRAWDDFQLGKSDSLPIYIDLENQAVKSASNLLQNLPESHQLLVADALRAGICDNLTIVVDSLDQCDDLPRALRFVQACIRDETVISVTVCTTDPSKTEAIQPHLRELHLNLLSEGQVESFFSRSGRSELVDDFKSVLGSTPINSLMQTPLVCQLFLHRSRRDLPDIGSGDQLALLYALTREVAEDTATRFARMDFHPVELLLTLAEQMRLRQTRSLRLSDVPLNVQRKLHQHLSLLGPFVTLGSDQVRFSHVVFFAYFSAQKRSERVGVLSALKLFFRPHSPLEVSFRAFHLTLEDRRNTYDLFWRFVPLERFLSLVSPTRRANILYFLIKLAKSEKDQALRKYWTETISEWVIGKLTRQAIWSSFPSEIEYDSSSETHYANFVYVLGQLQTEIVFEWLSDSNSPRYKSFGLLHFESPKSVLYLFQIVTSDRDLIARENAATVLSCLPEQLLLDELQKLFAEEDYDFVRKILNGLYDLFVVRSRASGSKGGVEANTSPDIAIPLRELARSRLARSPRILAFFFQCFESKSEDLADQAVSMFRGLTWSGPLRDDIHEYLRSFLKRDDAVMLRRVVRASVYLDRSEDILVIAFASTDRKVREAALDSARMLSRRLFNLHGPDVLYPWASLDLETSQYWTAFRDFFQRELLQRFSALSADDQNYIASSCAILINCHLKAVRGWAISFVGSIDQMMAVSVGRWAFRNLPTDEDEKVFNSILSELAQFDPAVPEDILYRGLCSDHFFLVQTALFSLHRAASSERILSRLVELEGGILKGYDKWLAEARAKLSEGRA